jgi:hypothetical protein
LKRLEIWVKMTFGRFAAAIASTASLLGLELYTTDGDFDHLYQVFLDVRKFKHEDFALYK